MADRSGHKKPYVFDTEGEAASRKTGTDPVETEDTQTQGAEEKPTARRKSDPSERRPRRTSSRPQERRSAAAPAKKRRRKKRKSPLRFLWLLIPVLLLAAGGWWLLQNYTMIGSGFYPKNAESVDLRSRSITLEEYAEARSKLPGAKILWNIPLSGGEYSCDSESIAVSRFTESDIGLLGYFENLNYIDAEAADLTPELYEALTEALPGAEIDWSVPVGGARFPSGAEEISLSELSDADIAALDLLPQLKTVDARACSDLDAVMALKAARPDLEVRWQVPFSGKELPDDTTELLIDDPSVSAAEVREALRYLPGVKSVSMPVCSWPGEEKDALRAELPEISFYWPVTICGIDFNGSETELDLSGRQLIEADIAEIEKNGPELTAITHVDLTGTQLSLSDAVRLKKVFPGADFSYTFSLYGKQVSTEDTFLDFTNVKMGSTEELENALELLTKLEKVEMTGCGISDEDMDALNKRHENVRFVWTMHFGRISDIRTDDKGFIGTMDHYLAFDNVSIWKLTYCEDMVCLDLGHRIPTGLKIDFLKGMPQMQYLVLADCRATDISPIGTLKNLIYLEMVMSYAADLTPLKECESLLDLNLCFSYNTYDQKDKNFDIFVSMADRLERLWFSSQMIDPNRVQELKNAMPNTDVHCIYATGQATGEGWRYHKRYYEMRDYLNMIYMADYGGRQYTKVIDGVEIPLSQEFLAQQRQPDWSKVRR